MIALPPVSGPLSAREYQVWELMAHGYDNHAMAAQFGISVKTIEKHRENLYRKLGVTSRVMAALQAARHGVVLMPPRSHFEVSLARAQTPSPALR